MRISGHLAAATALLVPLAQADGFLTPASVDSVSPLPYSFRDVVPPLQKTSPYGYRNESVKPWQAVQPSFGGASRPVARDTPECSFQSTGWNGQQQSTEFWLPNVPHNGTSPFLINGTDYQVYRDVTAFGAKGDGVTDDSAAFNKAITFGGRCKGGQCGGTTGRPALIYVPAGTYLLSSTVQLLLNTQVIGDALNPPTLKASANATNNFVLINGYDDGQPSLNNFFIGIRNVNLDTTAAPTSNTIYALNWAVSQATSLMNVNFNLRPQSNHVGLEMDGGSAGGGSGMFMGDLTFNGGLIGILFNNQQYAIRNVKFSNIATGIAFRHAFVVTLQQISCLNVGICIDLGPQGTTGSVNVIDSSCDTCGYVVNGSASILLENLSTRNSGPTLQINGQTKVSGNLAGRTYSIGYVHITNDGSVTGQDGNYLPYTSRGILANATGDYVTKSQPQYAQYDASAFSSVKDSGAKGDGQTDDTAALQAALNANANCKITYIPHGVYVITSTLLIPPGTRIVGEVWSILSASGSFFKDINNPKPLIQVGKVGSVGLAEFSDLLFTVADVLPGAILVEVNMVGTNPGDVSFHNVHTRVGGAADSLTETSCQSASEPCKAAFLHVHLTAQSSSYWENNWLWTADHDLDNTYPITMGVGRGMLVEATRGTWLVGTAAEHDVLYAYQLNNAQNVQASLMQVETPYWQPSPAAPYPWTPSASWSDPTFNCAGMGEQCSMSWQMRIIGSQSHTLALYGQAFWTFFNKMSSTCTGQDATCQMNSVNLQGLSPGQGVQIYNLNTRAVYDLIRLETSNGAVVAAQPDNYGSWGGVVTAQLGCQ